MAAFGKMPAAASVFDAMCSRRSLPPYHCAGPNRRVVLQLGSLSVLFAALPKSVAGSSAQAAARPAGAKSCIVLYMCGGPCQHDTWDPKPEAPAEVRGEFRPIATNVPGLDFGELMPRTAQLAHHLCVLRAVSTDDSSHASSVYYVLTGQPHSPKNTEGVRAGPPNDHPHFGAVLQSLRKDAAPGRLPDFVTLPEQMSGNDFAVPSGQTAGFLGQASDPWLLSCDPTSPQFDVAGLTLPAEISLDRLSRRHDLLVEVERHLGGAGSDQAVNYGRRLGQAYNMVQAASARQAFALDREPDKVRDRYGRHKFGQCVLLARRLIESGVSLVQVNWPREPNDRQTNNPLWDTHSNHHPRMREMLMPQMDLTYSALLEDLADRGLLNETLVIWMGEFGRTPRFNGAGGRDHWGPVFSLALAGGGVRGGTLIGASDKLGAYPRHGRVLPEDLTATIYHALGVDPAATVDDILGRPHAISRGEIIRGVF